MSQTAPAAPSIASDSVACSVLESIIYSCSSKTPNVAALTFPVAASCYCYPTPGIYAPNAYDAFLNGCAGYLSTADPVQYSLSESNLITSPCHFVGNVARAPSTETRAATYPPFALGLEACQTWLGGIQSCERATPNILQRPLAAQASCFCYAGDGSWAPTVYDDSRATCTDYWRTASPAMYSEYVAAPEDRGSAPCSRLGDVRATAAATGSGSASALSFSPSQGIPITVAATTSAQPGSSTGPSTEPSTGPSTGPMSTSSQGSAIGVGGTRVLWIVGIVALFVGLL